MTRTPLPSEIDTSPEERARVLKNLRNQKYRLKLKAAARPKPNEVDEAMVLALMRLQNGGVLPRTTMLQVIRTAAELLVEDGHSEVAAAVNRRAIELGSAANRPADSPYDVAGTTPADTPVTGSVRSPYPTSRIADPTLIAGRRVDAFAAKATL